MKLTTFPLDETDVRDPDEIRARFLLPRRPVVLRGLAKAWNATRTWTPASLAARHGELPIVLERCRPSRRLSDPIDYLRSRYYENVPLQRAVEEICSGTAAPGTYITYADVFSSSTELGRDVPAIHRELGTSHLLPARVRDALCSRPGFWLGPSGSLTVAHFDRPENFNAQIFGRKQWTLFSPSDSANLYANRAGTPVPIFSPCDIDELDLARFPRLARTRPLVATLDPGDVIFVPSGWWHHVRSLELSISVNFWWWTPACLKTLAKIGLGVVPISLRRWWRSDPNVASMPTD